MGKRKLIDKLTLKGQVIVTLILILGSSFLATALTFSITGMFVWGGLLGPAYPDLEKNTARYVAAHGVAIFQPPGRTALEQRLRGIPYQVVDNEGSVLFGSIRTPIVPSRRELALRLNTTEMDGRSHLLLFHVLQSTVTSYVPVLNSHGVLKGAVIVEHRHVGMGSPSVQGWITFLSYLIPFVPFLYFCLFSYTFAKRFGKRINRPLQVLVQGARRIEKRDLDFEIDGTGSNEIGQVLGAFEDMRVALKESLVRQWQMEDERRQMIAAISHDLRTPLTIIQGHVESLMETPSLDANRRVRYLETIMHNTKRVIQLMEDMHQVTELETPSFSLHPAPIDVQSYLLDWTQDFELMASRCGIGLEVHIDDRRAQRVPMMLDPKRISQILDNIASNSIRFTPQGGTITISLEIGEGALTCEISDTGKGFSPSELGHVFDRFYQGDAARSQAGHSGLGLYTAKTLVEKHGGWIIAENNPQGGATVRFTIRNCN